MTLDTADGKRSYPESEFIPLVIRYTSQTISRYKVETGLGMNAAAESTRLVSDESKPSPTLYPGGFACCGSRLEPLNLDPIVFKPFVKFRLQPGKRRVYVTADQVFPWDIQGESEEHGKALETTSNILSLDITPDPGWQKRELAAIREKCGLKPCPELNLLSTPEATIQKLKVIDQCDCQGISFLPSEYESAKRTMEEWIRDPAHAVPATAIENLAEIRAAMSRPEYQIRPDYDAQKGMDFSRKWLSAIAGEKADLVRELCAALPNKSPAARLATKKSVCEVVGWEPTVEAAACGCPAAR